MLEVEAISRSVTNANATKRISIFLISVNNSTNTPPGKELINANIDRYFGRAKATAAANDVLLLHHDNDDDDGKVHAAFVCGNMKSTLLVQRGRRKDRIGQGRVG